MGLNLENENNATKDAGTPGHAGEDMADATLPKTPSKTPEKKSNGAANATLHSATPNTGQRTATRVTEVFALVNQAIDMPAGEACEARTDLRIY